MDCLTCSGAPLEEKAPVEGLVIDLCAVCGGAWLDAGELERFTAGTEGFSGVLEDAMRTLLPSAHLCPRCSKILDRGWIAEAEVEFKVCSGCRGIWMDGVPLRRLRAYLKRCATPVAAPPAPPPRRLVSVASVAAVCVAVTAVWTFLRLPARQHNRFAETTVLKTGKTALDYEREALSHRATAEVAERQGNLDEAEEEYYIVSGLYTAAIVAAADPREAWRLESEYAKAGKAIAKMAIRRQAFAEAEEIEMVRFAIYERHRDIEGQARVWQELGEMLVAGRRELEAASRFDRAAALFLSAGDRKDAEDCRRSAAAARKSGS